MHPEIMREISSRARADISGHQNDRLSAKAIAGPATGNDRRGPIAKLAGLRGVLWQIEENACQVIHA